MGRAGAAWALIVVALAAALSVRPARSRSIPIASPFDMTGFIQSATVDNPNDLFSGGTITVNNIRMIVPRNTLLQFPATGMTWQEAFALAPAPYTGLQTGLAMNDVPRPATTYEVARRRQPRRRPAHRRPDVPGAAVAARRPGLHHRDRLRDG